MDVVHFWHKVRRAAHYTSALPITPIASTLALALDPPMATAVVSLTPSLQKLLSWYTRRNPVELWLDLLRNAGTFEDWEEAALHLDNLQGLDLWYVAVPRVDASAGRRIDH